jgi:polygalacturonase
MFGLTDLECNEHSTMLRNPHNNAPPQHLSRRSLLKLAVTGSGVAGLPVQAGLSGDPWMVADAIVKRLSKPLSFPKSDFVVTDFGAAPCATRMVKAWASHDHQEMQPTQADDTRDSYGAFKAAIDACVTAGGGRVVIPKGNWYCAGLIVLRSNVHVHLKAGARVFFSQKPDDYAKYGDHNCAKGKPTPSRWQSNDCLNYSSMIYAFNADNIALTGEDWSAVIEGQGGVPFNVEGDSWWTWKGKNRTLNAVAQNDIPNQRAGKISLVTSTRSMRRWCTWPHGCPRPSAGRSRAQAASGVMTNNTCRRCRKPA